MNWRGAALNEPDDAGYCRLKCNWKALWQTDRMAPLPQRVKKWFPTLDERFLAIEPFGEPIHPSAELIHRHSLGHEVHVEKCA
jgi:hypothetical protein